MLYVCEVTAQDPAAPEKDVRESIIRSSAKDTRHLGKFTSQNLESDGSVVMEGPFPSFVRVWDDAAPTQALEFTFNRDASLATLHRQGRAASTSTLGFLLAEKTSVLPDGTVVLSALDSEVVGKQAKLETHPGNHRIGFWGNAEDYVQWSFRAPAGDYEAELVYSRASRDGTEVEVWVDETKLPLALKTTGSWYRYRNVSLGDARLTDRKKHQASVRVKKIINGL